MGFEILFIIALIALQVAVFFHVRKKITAYKKFFPNSFSEIQIKKCSISNNYLKDPSLFEGYLNSLSDHVLIGEANDEDEHVELMMIPAKTRLAHKDFADVIKSTNAYLCKNKGASADFNILKDTCERHIEKTDNEIGNLINVPLYIGLGGTFIGIIIGLSGIDFSSINGEAVTISSDSIAQLINGVIAAMIASLVGLILTVVSTALLYKPAAFRNDTDKNYYYDFLQRELLPYLNIGVSRTLGSFKEVLSHFIVKFGENMSDYKDSGQLLNENLQKQQFVLEEINKLSLTRTASKIAEVFSTLNSSSEHLEKFHNYQLGLNTYLDKTDTVANSINSIITQFNDFNTNLKVISTTTLSSIELQKQFKDSLELHFPTINDHREVWRKQVDELNQDVKEVYKELNQYFKTSTENIQSFVRDNNDFLSGIEEIKGAVKIFVDNSAIQKDEFSVLTEQIGGLRNDFKDSQKQSVQTNLALIDAIKDLKITMSKIEIPVE